MAAQHTTMHQWIKAVESTSASVSTLCLTSSIKDEAINAWPDAFNFANDDGHCQRIAVMLDRLLKYGGNGCRAVRNLAGQLFARNPQGAFGELFAYDWLVRADLKPEMQIALGAKDVLSKNGSQLDGAFTIEGTKIYFDVKSFGLNGYLANALKNNLERLLPGKRVHIEGSWDVPLKSFEAMMERTEQIADALRTNNTYCSGPVHIRSESIKPVAFSSRCMDPYSLAEENASYAFKYANQFTKNGPFILIFVVHPWLGGSDIHNNYADFGAIFTRSFARRTFLQFRHDTRPVCNLATKAEGSTVADAGRLLSGLLFLNAWPATKSSDNTSKQSSWLYTNPLAKHRFDGIRLCEYLQGKVAMPRVDDFLHDIY